jgi:serine/threonine-protein kinase ATR
VPCGPEVAAAGRELREVSAILKLVAFTALKFPGVFYNGRAADVLSVIARIITFLAEPNFRHCLPSLPFRLR